jgi:hypothetical protein
MITSMPYSRTVSGGRSPSVAGGQVPEGRLVGQVVQPGVLGLGHHLIQQNRPAAVCALLVGQQIGEPDAPMAAGPAERDLPGFQEPDQGGPRHAQQAGGLAGGQHRLVWCHGDRQAPRQCGHYVTQHLEDLAGQFQSGPVGAGQRRMAARLWPEQRQHAAQPFGVLGGSTVRIAMTVMRPSYRANEQNERS